MRYVFAVLAASLLTVAAHAQIATLTDRFGYSGSVTKYASLADAQLGTNAVDTFTLDANRDFRLDLINGFTPFLLDQYHIGTNWTAPGSPSNTGVGFVQIPLQYGAPSIKAYWDSTLTTYTLQLAGALDAPNCRLWDGTAITANQAGAFLDYQLSVVASGLNTAAWDPTFGTYWSMGEPGSVEGKISGLFHNTSAGGAGYYTFDFDLNMESWAYDNFAGTSSYTPSMFAAPNAVPEPATYGLIAVAALAGLVVRRRFHSQRG